MQASLPPAPLCEDMRPQMCGTLQSVRTPPVREGLPAPVREAVRSGLWLPVRFTLFTLLLPLRPCLRSGLRPEEMRTPVRHTLRALQALRSSVREAVRH